jgi:hypothetical protein
MKGGWETYVAQVRVGAVDLRAVRFVQRHTPKLVVLGFTSRMQLGPQRVARLCSGISISNQPSMATRLTLNTPLYTDPSAITIALPIKVNYRL